MDIISRQDLVLDVVYGLGPHATVMNYVTTFVFEDLDTLGIFYTANPYLIKGLGRPHGWRNVMFVTKADARRLGIVLEGKGYSKDATTGTYLSDKAAVDIVKYHLSLPLPDPGCIGEIGKFDPWEIFPCFYGSYSLAFDQMAVSILEKMRDCASSFGEGLAEEMFREYLCRANLCTYGTSPRVCFPTMNFKPLLPELIEKWKNWSKLSWGE